jgi:prolyl oligopeptidase
MNDTEDTDPHRWLEAVDSDDALAWVRARNTRTREVLQAEPVFEAARDRLRAILDAKDRIPMVVRRGHWLYNLWQDAKNPRGLWRRTSMDEFRRSAPRWTHLLDLDALGKAEGENWVWAGATVYGPAYRLALVQLSRGGADATVVREFDLEAQRFVKDGFHLPEAKTRVSWGLHSDTVYVGTDFGAGSLTDSGYPRVIKRWRRGQPLAEAEMVFEGQASDVSVSVGVDRTPGFERIVLYRAIDFYREQAWLLQDTGSLALTKPDDASVSFWRTHVLLELRSDWSVAGHTWPAGSLLAAPADEFIASAAGDQAPPVRWQAVFTPTPTCALAGWDTTRRHLVLTLLDKVASRLEVWAPGADGWTGRPMAAPYPGSLTVQTLYDPVADEAKTGGGKTDEARADSALAGQMLVSYQDFLTPDSLLLASADAPEGAVMETLKTLPRHFDAEGMHVEQRFATSRDGTQVPYFVVWPQAGATSAPPPGGLPTLLYGYGGFEVSRQPFYSGGIGSQWLARGGVFVLANIRGGGEFGPSWHQAAIRQHKQNSYDDFIAVAEDLVATGVTQAARLGIMGGSNGGLLVGAVMVQRPELFSAVVCQVPLLDMRRYHQLLAGASWMAEYGNPDDAADWATIRRYSPYHNLRPGMPLPALLLITSTRDDRVHPGHARKMAARLEDMGFSQASPGPAQRGAVYYYENIEGGHGGAADNAQRADRSALEFSFLWRHLGA